MNAWWLEQWELLGREWQTRAADLFLQQHRDTACKWIAGWRHERSAMLRKKSREELSRLWCKEAPRRLMVEHWEDQMRGLATALLKQWKLPPLSNWSPAEHGKLPEQAWRPLDHLQEQAGVATQQVAALLELCCRLSGWQPDAAPEPVRQWLKAQGAAAAVPLISGPIRLCRGTELLPSPLSVLDHVLHREVTRSLSGQEGCLAREELDALLNEVHRLNVEFPVIHFHRGFLDVSLDPECRKLDLPGFNDACREWRLAGMLAARARAGLALKPLLDKCGPVFLRAVGSKAGRVISFLCFTRLLEEDLPGPVQQLLRGQLLEAQPLPGDLLWLAQEALDRARLQLRAGRHQPASLLLDPLGKLDRQLLSRAGVETAALSRNIRHCRARLQLRQGLFQEARELLRELEEEQPNAAATLTDLGLAEGALKSIEDLRVDRDAERRTRLLASLEQGEPLFSRALEQREKVPAAAHHALAVLAYLRCWKGDEQDRDALRAESLRQAREASRGMRASAGADYYEREGLLGQSLFIQSMLGMQQALGDPVQLSEAYECWKQISPQAGQFPAEHLKELLESAALVDEGTAAKIAESIWKYYKSSAWEILGAARRVVLRRSEFLREQCLKLLQNDQQQQAVRWQAACELLPVLLGSGRRGQLNKARQVLDGMETLAEAQHDCRRDFIEWLEDAKKYHPAWSEEEALWARIRLLRGLGGRDQECVPLLTRLFYKRRDGRPAEAKDLLRVLKDWKFTAEAVELRASLPEPDPDPVAADARQRLEDRLREGAELRLLFVGGNEKQERYDESILKEFRFRWPGVRVEFRHTGWSSNWGREKDKLKEECERADAVVLMSMMRTQLGRSLREGLNTPWLSCTGTGRGSILGSLKQAALEALRLGAGRLVAEEVAPAEAAEAAAPERRPVGTRS